MEWIRNKTAYHSVEEAILGMSGQSAEELLSPSEVPAEQVCGIKQAGETIEECIRKNMPVVIVGDYDADGITSTTILTRLLYSMGVKVRPIIPRRFTDGYGVSDSILKGVENSLRQRHLGRRRSGQGRHGARQHGRSAGPPSRRWP